MPKREPNEGHQRFMRDLCELNHRYESNGIPGIEQIACMAQRMGAMISDLPVEAGYTAPDILQSIALNIAAGNRERGKGVVLNAQPI